MPVKVEKNNNFDVFKCNILVSKVEKEIFEHRIIGGWKGLEGISPL